MNNDKHFEKLNNDKPFSYKENNALYNNAACEKCANNPKNGGSGICNCTLGMVEIRY